MIALVALGSNLGDRAAHLAAGLAALRELGAVTPSPLVLETPDEAGLGPDYLNTVAELDTPEEDVRGLLEALLRLELRLGRDRARGRNAPRTLDLDLLDCHAIVVATPALTLPHPRLHQRGFVLHPLAEVAPGWRHPVTGATVEALLAAMPPQEVRPLA